MAKKGETLSEEQRQKLSEAAKQRTGERNPFWGKTHSEETKALFAENARKQMMGVKRNEETKAKQSAALKGRVMSAETRAKMAASAKARCTPEWRARMSAQTTADRASGRVTNMPPVYPAGPDHPNRGQKRTEEQRQRMREAFQDRPGHAHSEESRGKISEGNAQAIKDRVRSYRYHVSSPDGGLVPCRTENERHLAQRLCMESGVVRIVGEDQMEWMPYELDGKKRMTIGDFLVIRSDGVQVLVEGKDSAHLYRDRERARLEAEWKWCQENGHLMILAVNDQRIPSVWMGPFVTEEFMESVRKHRVRFRTMLTVDPSAAVAPSACESPTCPTPTSSSE
jgi:hypothetical protein